MLESVTPLVLCYNEAPNIGRTLERLTWARRVVVVDSGSTDGTQAIVAGFPNATLIYHPFADQSSQWNFGLRETAIDTEWVLALDADYVLPAEFVDELRGLAPASGIDGYRARFQYCADGVPLRGGVYPPVTVLFRRARAHFVQEGHTQRVRLEGRIALLAHSLMHDDRKPIERWFSSQIGYMRSEARYLLKTPVAQLRFRDRIRRLLVVTPPLVLFYCLIAKGGLLDGRRGLFYALQRTVAEVMLSAFLVESSMHKREEAS